MMNDAPKGWAAVEFALRQKDSDPSSIIRYEIVRNT
jgi:hypothetical protein